MEDTFGVTASARTTLDGPPPSAAPKGAVDAVVAELEGLVERLIGLPEAASDAARIDRIGVLERLRGVVAGAQARETRAFELSQRATQAAQGVPAARLGRGIPEQVGLARRMSPSSAARQLGLVRDWMLDLPAVFDLLRRGQISEWAAQQVAHETRGLSRWDRQRIAAELAPDLPAMTVAKAAAAARRLAYEVDPAAVLARARTARKDRRVGLRPAPDTMAVLSAFLPVEQGVAAYAALDRHARGLKAQGDRRTLGQLRADTLVERVTGQAHADTMPVELGITISADSVLHDLFNTALGTTPDGDRDTDLADSAGRGEIADLLDGPSGDEQPANLPGYGPIPAALVRELILRAAASGLAVWARRLITDPVDETIAHVDTRRRRFDGALARLLRYRDQTCRDSYCDAAIRHLDHIQPHRDGGPTTAANGAALCERGNYTKDLPGWRRRTTSDPATGRPVMEIITPTGHRYPSEPPPALGPGGNQRARRRRTARRRLQFLERELRLNKPRPSGRRSRPPTKPPDPPRRE